MGGLEFYNVSRLLAARAFNDVELDASAFVQGLEAVGLNCGEVYEYVFTVFLCDETITFFCVEPFYCTLHVTVLPPIAQPRWVMPYYNKKKQSAPN